jgi:soluble lytic murein transglycosylase-like protein/tetratricopeptide (TPR) repeat protein
MATTAASGLIALLTTLTASSQPIYPSHGAQLPSSPNRVPGQIFEVNSATLEEGINAYKAGHSAEAIRILYGWLESRQGPWGEARANGRFLLGWLLKDANRYNEASTQFAVVRNSAVPLSEMASWWEAWVDHERGRHLVSARECAQYRTNWPYGVFHGDCLLLMAEAYAAAGHNRTARDTYNLWLDENPSSRDRDQVMLELARLESANGWTRGYNRLTGLMLSSDNPWTVTAAHQELMSHISDGATITNPNARAIARGTIGSLIQRGDLDAAWALFQQSGGNQASSVLGEWSLEESRRIMWRTRHFDEYVESQMESYLVSPSGETGWRIFRGYQKAGRFSSAAEWGERMMQSHSRHGRWRSAHDHIAQMWQLHGNYESAREHWRQLAQRRGRIGRAGRWYVAWTTFRLGELALAVELFSEIIGDGVEHKHAASYYLARTHQKLGDSVSATEQYSATLTEVPNSWYGELSRIRINEIQGQRSGSVGGTVDSGDGRWEASTPDEPALRLAPYTPINNAERRIPRRETAGSIAVTGAPIYSQQIDWGQFGNDNRPYQNPPRQAQVATSATAAAIPDSYSNNQYFNPRGAENSFDRFVQDNKHIWNNLPAIQGLASVGLYELAGPMMEAIRNEHREARQEQSPRASIVRTAVVSAARWRDASRHTRDHSTVARSTRQPPGGQHVVDATDPAALWLNFPTAHISTLTEHGEDFGIDPLLALSLVRQESLYQASAESRVGANGLMQVMPITGTRVSLDLGESFSPAQLNLPNTNIRYGTWYLSQLMNRFEDCWPMALAAYNAGPMNVSSWFSPWTGNIDLDDFVEQIPFRETREYVKSVIGYYSIHLALYRPTSSISFPIATGHDHSDIIDY